MVMEALMSLLTQTLLSETLSLTYVGQLCPAYT